MTTLAQLDKAASKQFGNAMRRRGFAVERRFLLWRKRGPLFDMFVPQILAGDLLRVRVSIWSPWADRSDGQFQEFPPSACLIGGDLGDDFPTRMHSGELFEIENAEQIEASLRRLLEHIDARALPWFAKIVSSSAYMAYVGAHGFHPVPEYAEQLRENIRRGFELEPFL